MIDWDKIEAARAKLAHKEVLPPGYFTAQMYAERFKVAKGHASSILRDMFAAGAVERIRYNRGFAFKLTA